jgi:hypothetical protein
MPIYEFTFPTLEDMQPMGPEEHDVHLPINKEIAEALEVDGRAEVTFNGTVKEISAGFDASDDNYSIRIAITKIEVYPENEFTELSKDD